MNDNPTTTAQHYCDQMEASLRENPVRAIAIALGVGLFIGLAVRALQPQPPVSRVTRLLEDLQDRVHDLSDRAVGLAESGAERVRDLHVERNVRSLGDRLRRLFH